MNNVTCESSRIFWNTNVGDIETRINDLETKSKNKILEILSEA
jgi:hypothetical protein